MILSLFPTWLAQATADEVDAKLGLDLAPVDDEQVDLATRLGELEHEVARPESLEHGKGLGHITTHQG